MASPFKIFRKHQKILIATLGLMAMIAFVFLPILLQLMETRSVQDPVVVKTAEYGNIHSSQLRWMVGQRQRMRGAVDDVYRAVRQAGGSARQAVMMIGQMSQVNSEAVADTWLLARHAEANGLAVGEQTIKTFFRELTEDRIRKRDLEAILKRYGFSAYGFSQAIRDELLAMQLRMMFDISVEGTPPAQRWEYFNRLKRMATIEVVPVAVDRYAQKVPDPGDETLLAFFEEYKQVDPNPNTPEPGFHEPHKIAVRYVKAEARKFMDPDGVTEEEIRQRYLDRRAYYDRVDEIANMLKGARKSAEDKKPTVEGSPSYELPPDAEEPADAKPKDSDDTSSAGVASPFMLTALLQEQTGEKGSAAPEPPAAAPEPPAVEGSPSYELPPDAEKPPGELKEPKAEPPRVTVEISDYLKGVIREQLAREKARKKAKEVVVPLRGKMKQYQGRYAVYQSHLAANEPATPPTKPDIEKFAGENHLTFGKTPLISQFDVNRFDVGNSFIDGHQTQPFVRGAFEQNLKPYVPKLSEDAQDNSYVFWKVEDVEAHTPKFTDKGVRERVLQAWRMVQARELAIKEAQRLAEVARKANGLLTDAFADQPDIEVSLTAPFSWMTYGSRGADSRTLPGLSPIVDASGRLVVDRRGPDFMQTVFELKEGELGVAMNDPKTIAYLIRVAEMKPSERLLRTQFEIDPRNYFVYTVVGYDDREKIRQDWMNEIKSAAGLEWVKPVGGGR